MEKTEKPAGFVKAAFVRNADEALYHLGCAICFCDDNKLQEELISHHKYLIDSLKSFGYGTN